MQLGARLVLQRVVFDLHASRDTLQTNQNVKKQTPHEMANNAM